MDCFHIIYCGLFRSIIGQSVTSREVTEHIASDDWLKSSATRL